MDEEEPSLLDRFSIFIDRHTLSPAEQLDMAKSALSRVGEFLDVNGDDEIAMADAEAAIENIFSDENAAKAVQFINKVSLADEIGLTESTDGTKADIPGAGLSESFFDKVDPYTLTYYEAWDMTTGALSAVGEALDFNENNGLDLNDAETAARGIFSDENAAAALKVINKFSLLDEVGITPATPDVATEDNTSTVKF